jgi:hypothetical protein
MATDNQTSYTSPATRALLPHTYTVAPTPPAHDLTDPWLTRAHRELTGDDGAAVAWVSALKRDGDLPRGPFHLLDETGRVVATWASSDDVPDPIGA